VTGLSANTTYTVTVTDSRGCIKTSSVTIGINGFTFEADYIVVSYEFTNGDDLDTRTRVVSPNIGQNVSCTHIGFGQWAVAPQTGTPMLKWGGDNMGTGFESCLIDVKTFKIAYPTQTQILIDMRAHWYGTVGTNPINIKATMFKGGTIVPSGYTFTNPTATSTATATSVPKVLTYANRSNCDSGERLVTLLYDVITNIGVFNSNDITTPSV
jgi:hypothetical protein